ncbi:MAG: hypothetical protein ACSNEK_03145 [Parachlamydiaceae bacterium]
MYLTEYWDDDDDDEIIMPQNLNDPKVQDINLESEPTAFDNNV